VVPGSSPGGTTQSLVNIEFMRLFYAINSTLSLHLLHYLHVNSNAKLSTYLVEKGTLLGVLYSLKGVPLKNPIKIIVILF